MRLNYSFYQDARKASGHDVAAGISIPTLIVHGAADETVPLSQSRKLASLLPRGELVVIPGADHLYTREEDFETLVDRLSGFIIRHVIAS